MIKDLISYLIGLLQGQSHVILEDGDYIFSDPNNDGHIVITKKEEQ